VIDVGGLTVAPGFIDVHSHAIDGLNGGLNTAGPLLAQGVTTVFVNHDGAGVTDLPAQRAKLAIKGVGVNVAQFVPHGAIRQAVMGLADRAPRRDEFARIARMVQAGMEAGGLGLSTGLYYAPGSYSTTSEIVALARIAARYGGVYASHIRDEGDYSVGVAASVQEVIEIAEQAKITAVVSHMKALGPAVWGMAPKLTAMIDQARARGLKIYADQYPYEASGTTLAAAVVPRWAEVGGRDAFLKRLTGPERERIKAAVAENLVRRGGPRSIVLTSYGRSQALKDPTIEAVAAERGQTPIDTIMALLERSDWPAISFSMSEDDIAHIMRQPWTMTCSDGELSPPGRGRPHPRGYGAFARKLAVYARERRVIGLPEAVRSMTSLPAEVFGLKDRGGVRRGALADLVVFDPETIADTATYESPHRLAAGVRYVLVNGVVAIDDGKPTGATAGRFVTPEH
jgi:N-acyl-D-amino-acid deacylase